MAKRKSDLQKQAEVTIKQINPIALVVVIICLIAGLLGGWFSYKAVTKNDTFTLVGEKEITLNVGETYLELGAKIVEFGKDVSNSVIITGEVDTSKAGEYAIYYTVKSNKYKDVQKIRVVKVVDSNE